MFNNNETTCLETINSKLENNSSKVSPNTIVLTDENKENVSFAKIPRPINAFILYSNQNRRTIALENPKDSNKEISRKLGKKWRSLNSEEKSKYYSQANRIASEHKRKFPTYCYNPKLARLNKIIRLNDKLIKNQNKLKNTFKIDSMNVVKTDESEIEKSGGVIINTTSTFDASVCLDSSIEDSPPVSQLPTSNNVNSDQQNEINGENTEANVKTSNQNVNEQQAVDISPTSTTASVSQTLKDNIITHLPLNNGKGQHYNHNRIHDFIQLGGAFNFLIDGTMCLPYLTIPRNINNVNQNENVL